MQLQPQWLFLSSWNEHVAQALPGATGKAMGFSGDPTIGMFGFVDTYASVSLPPLCRNLCILNRASNRCRL